MKSLLQLLNSFLPFIPELKLWVFWAPIFIRAISSGDAEVKAEIPEANASYVTTIFIRNEGGAPTTPQPQKTVALVPASTTTINISETARNEKINMIPGFEVLTAILGILSVYVVFRKMQAK
ncbi:MAG: hypothetical protein V6S10_08145 [Candidatus Methanoglobus sp.]